MMTANMHPICNLSKYDKINKVDQNVYRGMIGSILYITTYKPDILFSVFLCTCWIPIES